MVALAEDTMRAQATPSKPFIDVLKQRPTSRTPIWMMRQAGRYLPEYRALRAQVNGFLPLCQNPELAAEVTIQPLKRFKLDAAIIFSDILVIPEAMGLGLHFVSDHGPAFHHIPKPEEYHKLAVPDPDLELGYVLEAIKKTKRALTDTPLIGFCGSPWTVATYMVEGGTTKQFSKIRAMVYQDPKLLHVLLQKLTQASILYLKAQAAAGADALMIFDTWGGLLDAPRYQNFSLDYMQAIVKAIKADNLYNEVPIIIFSKNGGRYLDKQVETGCQALGLDWTADITQAKAEVNGQVALQGNLDPAILLSNPECVIEETKKVLRQFGHGGGHIFNLGHGIYPNTPIENVEALINTVHSESPHYHGEKS